MPKTIYEVSQTKRNWANKNPQKVQQSQLKTQLKQYGLTVEDYEKRQIEQEGRCAICLIVPQTRRLCVDHCHETGTVRGLLCHNCNVGLGMLGNIGALQAAITYLTQFHPPK